MKRKLALLLALIMVLSLVPANVFANDPAPGFAGSVSSPASAPTGTRADSPGRVYSITVDVGLISQYLGVGTADPAYFGIALNLVGGNATNLRFVSPGSVALPRPGEPLPNPQVTPPLLTSFNVPTRYHGPGTSPTLYLPVTNVILPAAAAGGSLTGDMWLTGHQSAMLWLSPAGLEGLTAGSITIQLPFPIRVNTAADRLYARLGHASGTTILARGNLMNIDTTGIGIVYNGPDPVVFEWEAVLDHIEVRESVVGAIVGRPQDPHFPVAHGLLTVDGVVQRPASQEAPGRAQATGQQPLMIRLLGPAGYVWDWDDDRFEVVDPYGILIPGAYTTHVFQIGTNREELIIRFNGIERTTVPHLVGQLGRLSIRGLELVPHGGTARTGDLYVNVRVGFGGMPFQLGPVAGTTGANRVGFPANPWSGAPDIPYAHGAWRAFRSGTHTEDLLVARRVIPAITLETIGDLPELRSGYAIGWGSHRPTFIEEGTFPWAPAQHASSAGDLNPGRPTTGRSAVLRLQENVNNALDMSLGRYVDFTVPEGFTLTGFQWRYYTGTTMPADNAGWTSVSRPYAHENPGVNVNFLDDNTVRLRRNIRAQVHGESWPAYDATEDELDEYLRQALRTPTRNTTVRLEVRFFVSVEAGSAGRGLDEMVVTVTGPGVNNLDERANSISVAEVFDPVTIRHIGDPILVDLIGHEQNIYHANAGAIQVTETEGGMLQMGTRLWVQVAPRYGIGHPLAISRGTVLTDAASGLGLTVRQVTQANMAFQTHAGIIVEVTSESTEGNPGTITFDGITLFGHVYHGDAYYLIVTGPAIAENHVGVVGSGVYHSQALGGFLNPPYYVEIIETLQEEGFGDNRALSLNGVTFTTGVNFRGVANPIIWRRLPGMQHEGGFVSMRAFALAAGIDEANITWASRVATISGFNYFGQSVVVSVSPDSNRATIVTDGIPTDVDIAMMADGLTGPYGTVRPLHEAGTIYLPLRFMFNVFGYSEFYTLVRQGQSAVISAN